MSGDNNDTARRLIANIIKYTLPGQIELPVNWVIEDVPEKSNENDDASNNSLINYEKNDVINVLDKKVTNDIVESTVADETFESENLEDGELEDDDEEGDDENMEKETTHNISAASTAANTCFDSLNENNNGSDSNDDNKKGSKSAQSLEVKRQKVGHLICRFFREGNCREGDACVYSHNAADSHRTPELCKGYVHGTCRKQLKCPLLHGEHPCKDFVFGRCAAVKCRFSHQPLNDYTKLIFEKTLKDEEQAAANCARPISPTPPFLLSATESCPPNFSHQPPPPRLFSSSSNSIRTNHNSLPYNKNSFRAHPYKKSKSSKSKLPKLSKPISPIPLRNVSATTISDENLLSEVAFNLPHLRQCC